MVITSTATNDRMPFVCRLFLVEKESDFAAVIGDRRIVLELARSSTANHPD